MVPSSQVYINPLACILSIITRERRQSRAQLYECCIGGFVQAEVCQKARWIDKEESLNLLFVESRQVRAILFHQRPPAAAAAFGKYWNACPAQCVHVAMDSSL